MAATRTDRLRPTNWDMVWEILEDIRGQSVAFKKVKAHGTYQEATNWEELSQTPRQPKQHA